MKLSPRNKLIAVAVAAGLVVILLFAVLILPAFNEMKDLGAQISTAEQEAQAATALLEQRREVKDAASVTDATLIQLSNAVPANPELPSLIIELQDVAYSTGVSLRIVTPSDPTQEDGEDFVTIPVAIEFWGTWADSVDYLQQLRRLSRQVRVAEFESTLARRDLGGRGGHQDAALLPGCDDRQPGGLRDSRFVRIQLERPGPNAGPAAVGRR